MRWALPRPTTTMPQDGDERLRWRRWPDILVANASVAQQLFRNRGWKLEALAAASGAAYDADGHSFAGKGADFADQDNDGWPDMFVNALATQRYSMFHNRKGVDYVSDSTAIGAAIRLEGSIRGPGHVVDNSQLSLRQCDTCRLRL